MDNLISKCFVIESLDFGPEPVVYLRQPSTHPTNEMLHEFPNPFTAKAYIRSKLPISNIIVTKETHSQMMLVGY